MRWPSFLVGSTNLKTTTMSELATITVESSNHLESAIQRKQDEILQLRQRLVRLQVELAQMKKRKASMKAASSIREQLRAVMRPG